LGDGYRRWVVVLHRAQGKVPLNVNSFAVVVSKSFLFRYLLLNTTCQGCLGL
jgi:hypothetical protein